MSEDKSTEITSFNGVFVDIKTNDEGNLEFAAGYDFEDDVNEEYIEYMKDMLAGIFSAVQNQMEALVMTGRIVRSTPGFEEYIGHLSKAGEKMVHEGNVVQFSSKTKH